MEFLDYFNALIYVPNITNMAELQNVLTDVKTFTAAEKEHIMSTLRGSALESKLSIGIKKLLYIIEMASQDVDKVDKFLSTVLEEGALGGRF
jgi:vesicle-fusing ATPase